MSGKGGKDWLLKREDTAGSGTFTTIGGLRETNMTFNAEAIDSTDQGSSQNRTLLSGAGIKSMSVSGSGIFTNSATLSLMEDDFISQVLVNFRLVDADSGRSYTGAFKITSFERGGAYNAEQTYSVSLESSGAITIS